MDVAVSPSLMFISLLPLKISISLAFFSRHSSLQRFKDARAYCKSSWVEYVCLTGTSMVSPKKFVFGSILSY